MVRTQRSCGRGFDSLQRAQNSPLVAKASAGTVIVSMSTRSPAFRVERCPTGRPRLSSARRLQPRPSLQPVASADPPLPPDNLPAATKNRRLHEFADLSRSLPHPEIVGAVGPVTKLSSSKFPRLAIREITYWVRSLPHSACFGSQDRGVAVPIAADPRNLAPNHDLSGCAGFSGRVWARLATCSAPVWNQNAYLIVYSSNGSSKRVWVEDFAAPAPGQGVFLVSRRAASCRLRRRRQWRSHTAMGSRQS